MIHPYRHAFSALIFCVGYWAGCPPASAQNHPVDGQVISGGGGTSSGGNYSVSGSMGQMDATANNALSGGSFSLTGGFWSLYAVQTMGYPALCIRLTAPDTVVVSWQNTGSHALQANADLTTTNWINYPGGITLNNGTNSVTLSPVVGNWFFRLQ